MMKRLTISDSALMALILGGALLLNLLVHL